MQSKKELLKQTRKLKNIKELLARWITAYHDTLRPRLPGAHLLNGYSYPGKFTVYTDRNWQSFKDIGLVPDDNGKVELLDLFWSPEICNGIPPVLIYADLMSSGSDRNFL